MISKYYLHATMVDTSSPQAQELLQAVNHKGDEIKALKALKPPTLKEDLIPLVEELVALKAQYKELTGEELSGSIKDKKKKEKVTTTKKDIKDGVSMEELMQLCKARGFVFQSSEIYQPFPGFFDFGPLGVELKNNIKKLWWRDMVQRREDMVGLDSSIIASPDVWKASGHIAGFSDPMVDCKETKLRFRADQIFWSVVETTDGKEVGYVSVMETEDMEVQAMKLAKKLLKEKNISVEMKPLVLKELTLASKELIPLIPSPGSGQPGHLTEPRDFNLMFQTKCRCKY